ncbi:MAG: hypothetical protein OEY21_07065 [Nitrospira sp.]|nr:hypothetical protein [Nitrospira sp.]
MASLLEYVGSVHIYLGPYRGNPIALYLKRTETGCQIGPKVYPWNDVMGVGDTPNKAAADFEEKWKTRGLTANMYSGPAWEGGVKPEKPAPPKPAAPPPPKPAASATASPAPASPPAPQAAPERGSTLSVTDGQPAAVPTQTNQLAALSNAAPEQATTDSAANGQQTTPPVSTPEPTEKPN